MEQNTIHGNQQNTFPRKKSGNTGHTRNSTPYGEPTPLTLARSIDRDTTYTTQEGVPVEGGSGRVGDRLSILGGLEGYTLLLGPPSLILSIKSGVGLVKKLLTLLLVGLLLLANSKHPGSGLGRLTVCLFQGELCALLGLGKLLGLRDPALS